MVKWSSSYENHDRIVGARVVGNIVLPLTSYSGTSVGFQVRSIREKAYDSFTIKRRPEGYFFGIAPNVGRVWSTKEVTLVEGPFDQLIYERLVDRNVVALTTSVIGKLQTRFLYRFVRTVNMCLDVDAAGRDGVKRARDRLDGLNVRDIRCPVIRTGDKDLSDFWKAVGDDRVTSFFKKKMKELI
jgi:DNA primase